MKKEEKRWREIMEKTKWRECRLPFVSSDDSLLTVFPLFFFFIIFYFYFFSNFLLLLLWSMRFFSSFFMYELQSFRNFFSFFLTILFKVVGDNFFFFFLCISAGRFLSIKILFYLKINPLSVFLGVMESDGNLFKY